MKTVLSTILIIIFAMALLHCESKLRTSAIDARASLASMEDAKAIVPFMDQGYIEKMILNGALIQSVVAAYPDRFMSMTQITGVVWLEGEDDLAQYPDRDVICPSFCGLVAKPRQLATLFKTYPRFHVDIGFASTEALQQGLLKISKDPAPMRQLILDYPDRFLFATGLQVTAKNRHDEIEILGAFKGYRRLLHKAHYHFPKLSRLWEKRGLRLQSDGALHGLFLPKEVQEKIYRENILRLITH